MRKQKNRRNKQAGFTLVEVAIVLVIIGLLVGGILKGQEMIKNAKVKNFTKQADELRAAVNTYRDRYRIFPGDDNDPVGHTGVGGLTPGNANGQISGAEDEDVFMHLAAANLISGSYSGNFPNHTFGGTSTLVWATIAGRTTHWINNTNVPGDVGRMVDASLDDGTWNTGSVRSSANYNNNVPVTLSLEF